MRICIYIPGQVEHGLWSPERGESRWAQNWASFLATEGHKVTCIATPALWGSCPPQENVELVVRVDPETQPFDLYMDSCWWPGKDLLGAKARTYVHLHYGWEMESLTTPGFIDKQHIVAYPYELGKDKFIHDKNPFRGKTFCLPVPLAESFGKSHANAPYIVFSAKEAFFNRQSDYWHKASYSVIEAMEKVCQEQELLAVFMMSQELQENSPQSGETIKKMKIQDLLKRQSKAEFYSIMPLGMVMELLKKTRILLPVISPGGSMIEGVVNGIVPLTWSGSLFDKPAQANDFLLRHDASFLEIYQKLSQLAGDTEFYNKLLAEYQPVMNGHLYPQSRTFFSKIIEYCD